MAAFPPSKLPGSEGAAEHAVRGVTGDESRGGRAISERAPVGHQAVAVSLAGVRVRVWVRYPNPNPSGHAELGSDAVCATRGLGDKLAWFCHGRNSVRRMFRLVRVSAKRGQAESDVKQTSRDVQFRTC